MRNPTMPDQPPENEAELRAAALAAYVEVAGGDAGFYLLWPLLKAQIKLELSSAGVQPIRAIRLRAPKPISAAEIARKYVVRNYRR